MPRFSTPRVSSGVYIYPLMDAGSSRNVRPRSSATITDPLLSKSTQPFCSSSSLGAETSSTMKMSKRRVSPSDMMHLDWSRRTFLHQFLFKFSNKPHHHVILVCPGKPDSLVQDVHNPRSLWEVEVVVLIQSRDRALGCRKRFKGPPSSFKHG